MEVESNAGLEVFPKDVWISIFLCNPVWFECRLVCKTWNRWICSSSKFWKMDYKLMRTVLNNTNKKLTGEVWKKISNLSYRPFSSEDELFYRPRLKIFDRVVVRFDFSSWRSGRNPKIAKVTFFNKSDLQELKTMNIESTFLHSNFAFFQHENRLYFVTNDRHWSRLQSIDVNTQDLTTYHESHDSFSISQFRYPYALIARGCQLSNIFDFDQGTLLYSFPYMFHEDAHLMDGFIITQGEIFDDQMKIFQKTILPKKQTNIITQEMFLCAGSLLQSVALNGSEFVSWNEGSIQIYSSRTGECLFTKFLSIAKVTLIVCQENLILIELVNNIQSLCLWKQHSKNLVPIVHWVKGKEPHYYTFVNLLPFGVIRLVRVIFFIIFLTLSFHLSRQVTNLYQ